MGRDTLMKVYTRSEAISILEAALSEFENDHEEYTGITDTERMPLINWWGEIRNLIENSS